MAAVSNYPRQPRGPRRLIYSGALGGAVRERTPSVLLCSLTMLNGPRSKTLDAQLQIILRGHAIVPFFPSFLHVFLRHRSALDSCGCKDRNAIRGRNNRSRAVKEKSRFSSFPFSFPHTRGGSDYRRRRRPSNICVYHGTRLIVCLTSCEAAAASHLLTAQLSTITYPGGDDIKSAFDVKRCLEERVSRRVTPGLLPF